MTTTQSPRTQNGQYTRDALLRAAEHYDSEAKRPGSKREYLKSLAADLRKRAESAPV